MQVTATNPDGPTTVQPLLATAVVQSAAPVNTTAPTLTGTAQRTLTLTATAGMWSGIGNAVTYQWQRSSDKTNWQTITAANGLTYTLTAADELSYVRLEVTVTNIDGSAFADTPASAQVQGLAPIVVTPPVLSGTGARGSALTVTAGVWQGLGNTYTYEWKEQPAGSTNWNTIFGATTSTYTPTLGDEGSAINAIVTATNVNGNASSTSNAISNIAGAPPIETSLPVLTGVAQRLSVLSATTGVWLGAGNAYSEQWQECAPTPTNTCATDVPADWTSLASQTSTRYTVVKSDEGSLIRMEVTATNLDATTTADSPPTATVAAASPVMSAAPVLTGTPQRTYTLTTTRGAWTSGPDNTYVTSWLRCDAAGDLPCPAILGQSASSYTLVAADTPAGNPLCPCTIRSQVTASNVNGIVTVQSAPSPVISAAPPTLQTAPVLTGTPRVGAVLSATAGVWSPTDVTFAYQWQNSPDGTSWTDISSATGKTYTLQGSDTGLYVHVKVTAENTDAPSGVPAYSAPTSAVLAPPTNSIAPGTPSGTLTNTYTLTADPGVWNAPNATITDTWERCAGNAIASACTTVATGPTYVLQAADVGDHIGVVVTATTAGGTSTPADSYPLTDVITGRPLTNIVAPSITGDPQVPDTLTASPGQWSVPLTSITYVWARCDLAGANCAEVSAGSSTKLTPADDNSTTTLQATATSPGQTERASQQCAGHRPGCSAPAGHVRADHHRDDAARVHADCDHRQLDQRADGITEQWQRCGTTGKNCSPIPGATALTYTLATPDENAELEVTVYATNATNAGGPPVAASSQPTVLIAASPPKEMHVPAIYAPLNPQTGLPLYQDGVALTAIAATWQPASPDTVFSYQWLQCNSSGMGCALIAGATGQSYIPVNADAGQTLMLRQTAANSDGLVPAVSPVTPVIAVALPRWKALPTIFGAAHVNDVLGFTSAVWLPVLDPTLTKDTVNMMSCTNVCTSVQTLNPGDAYTISTLDLGAILRVQETARNIGDGDQTVLWSPTYVGPVISAAAGDAILGAHGAVAVRSASGKTLATAQLTQKAAPTQ